MAASPSAGSINRIRENRCPRSGGSGTDNALKRTYILVWIFTGLKNIMLRLMLIYRQAYKLSLTPFIKSIGSREDFLLGRLEIERDGKSRCMISF
jgi:hypothetical protein